MELYRLVRKCIPNPTPAAVHRPIHHSLAHHAGHMARRSFHHIIARVPPVFGETCRYVPIALGIGATALAPLVAVTRPAALPPVVSARAAAAPASSSATDPGAFRPGAGMFASPGMFGSTGGPDELIAPETGHGAPNPPLQGLTELAPEVAGSPTILAPAPNVDVFAMNDLPPVAPDHGTQPVPAPRHTDLPMQNVPEPDGLLLFATGVAAFALLVRRTAASRQTAAGGFRDASAGIRSLLTPVIAALPARQGARLSAIAANSRRVEGAR